MTEAPQRHRPYAFPRSREGGGPIKTRPAELATAPPPRWMARKPEPPTWNSKAVWLGIIEAPDEAAAMEKAAAEFKVPANRLMAIRR
jgi:hypothetical protein